MTTNFAKIDKNRQMLNKTRIFVIIHILSKMYTFHKKKLSSRIMATPVKTARVTNQ